MATQNLPDYFTSRGLQHTAPERLNTSLRLVLDSMPTLLYGEAEAELTSEEQAILKEGGIDLDTDHRPGPAGGNRGQVRRHY